MIEDRGTNQDGPPAALGGPSGCLWTLIGDADQLGRLDRLLDRYCHRLRNRLNSLKLSLYLTRKLGCPNNEPLHQAEASYRSIEQMIEALRRLVGPIKLAPHELSLHEWVAERRRRWAKTLQARDIHLEVVGPSHPIRSRCDPTALGDAWDALIAFWAVVAPHGADLTLHYDVRDERVQFDWTSATPGPWFAIPDGQADPLVLPMLLAILKAHGGALDLAGGPNDPLSLSASWPVEPPAPSEPSNGASKRHGADGVSSNGSTEHHGVGPGSDGSILNPSVLTRSKSDA